MVFLRKPLLQNNSTRLTASPPAKPLPNQHDTGIDDNILEDLAEAFEQLYDPEQMNHLAIGEQLKFYKSRDLRKSKLYKTAHQYFGHYRTVLENTGENKNRKRVIVSTSNTPALWQTSVHQPIMDVCSTKVTFPQVEVHNDNNEEEDFKSWIARRRTLRNNLNNFGNVEHYLRNKADLSSYEKRIQKNIKEFKKKKCFVEEKKPLVEKVVAQVRKDVQVNQPSPLALAVIDYELKKRKIRLLDLFATVDKDKNWFLSREEFKHAFKIAKIPLPASLLEDLVITLDNDNNNRLDYREINTGLQNYRREKRLGLVNYANTIKKLQEEFNAQDDVIDDDQRSYNSSSRLSYSASVIDKDEHFRQNSKLSTTSIETNHGDTINLLTPPPNDVRPEQFVNENPEIALDLRVRDRAALHRFNAARQLAASERWRGESYIRKLKEDAAGADNMEKRNVIRTGNAAYDAHCSPSSMSNDSELVHKIDAYRQDQFREYIELMRLCQSRGIVLNEKLFEKVLLHPGDKPPEEIRHNVRQPGAQLRLSSNFYRKAVPSTGNSVDSSALESTRVSSTGRRKRAVNLACLESSLPTNVELLVDDEDAEKELSTGMAYVRRKVDCWLTFEEFQRLTDHLDYTRQRKLTVASANAFWPGHLADRLRRHVDTCSYSSNVFFQNLSPVVGTRCANPGFMVRQFYPLSDHGHVTYANIDPKLNYEITRAH